ncbi:hypothetical protein DPMN_087937 [Dreissena polymorpha]|uniref:Uncharacterized protein n=1 Tax=Dreissena polymorpha TaxID=45954 RepID=A0A9D4QXE8_DREPO|nr:hypothetical protein DPMN_087937 [Dreissena polymorpha]
MDRRQTKTDPQSSPEHSGELKKTFPLHATFMTSLDVTSCRPEPQICFTSRFSVLSTAVLRHFNYLLRAILFNSWSASLPKVCSVFPLLCHLCCSRSSSGYEVKPLSRYVQLPFHLVILPSSGSQRNQWERTSGSRDDSTRLINKAALLSSPIRPSSDNVVKPLSTYGQLPFRLVILPSSGS